MYSAEIKINRSPFMGGRRRRPEWLDCKWALGDRSWTDSPLLAKWEKRGVRVFGFSVLGSGFYFQVSGSTEHLKRTEKEKILLQNLKKEKEKWAWWESNPGAIAEWARWCHWIKSPLTSECWCEQFYILFRSFYI